MYGDGQSDDMVVPTKLSNKGRKLSAETDGGKHVDRGE